MTAGRAGVGGSVGLLLAVGETKGRHYVAGEALRDVGRALVASGIPLEETFKAMAGKADGAAAVETAAAR